MLNSFEQRISIMLREFTEVNRELVNSLKDKEIK